MMKTRIGNFPVIAPKRVYFANMHPGTSTARRLLKVNFSSLLLFGLLGLCCIVSKAYGDTGNFGPYLITNTGGSDIFTGATTGSSLGTATNGSSNLWLDGAQITTWADGGNTRSSANFWFRTYRDASPLSSPSFSSVSLPSVSIAGNNELWEKKDYGYQLYSTNSMAAIYGAIYSGTYSADYYYQAVFNWGSQYNYVGTSTATTAPSSGFYTASYTLAGYDYYLDQASGSNNQTSVSGGNGTLTGSVGIGKFGNGTVTLTNTANNYTGRTFIAAGTLQNAASGVISDGSNLIIKSGAVYDLNNFNETINSVSEYAVNDGGTITLGSGTLTISGASQGTKSQNSISGTGGLVYNATNSTLYLYGTQGFTGSTSVQAGTLQASVSMSSGNFSLTGGTFETLTSNAISDSASITMGGGTLLIGGSETIGSVTLSSGTSSVMSVNSNQSLTASGTISGAGNLTKQGDGTLYLTQTNTYTGATTISAGTLQIGNGGTTGNLSASSAITNNGTLAFNRTNTVTQGTDFASTIGGTGNLTQSGSGTLILSGANTYTGDTRIAAGNLQIASAGSISSSSTIYVGNGGTADIAQLTLGKSDGGQTIANAMTVNPTSGGATDYTKRIISGANTSGANTFSGTITVNNDVSLSAASGGTLAFGLLQNGSSVRTAHATGAGTVVLQGSSDNLNIALAVDSGMAQLAKTSSSSVHAVGNQFGTALTVNSGGTAQLAGSGGDQIYDNSGVVINSDSVFDLNGKTETINNISLNGTGIGSTGALINSSGTAATLTLTGSSSLAGPTRVGGTGDIVIDGAGAITMGSGQTLTKVGSNKLTLSNGSGVDNVNLLLQVDAGTVVLNKASTSGGAHSVGGLTINSGGVVQLSGSGGYQIYDGAAAAVNSGGVLDMFGQNQTFTTGSLTLSGTGISSGGALINSSGSSSTLTGAVVLGANSSFGGSGNLTLSGVISGDSKTLTKVGNGKLTLNGANTYTGSTTISAGTLALGSGGSFESSPTVNLGTSASPGTLDLTAKSSFTFGANQTVSGTGEVNIGNGKVVTINGNFAPGNSPGIVSVTGSLTLAGTTTLDIDGVIGAGVGYDQTILSGDLTYGGALVFNIGNLLASNSAIQLFDAAGLYSGNFASVAATGSYGALTFTLNTGVWEALSLAENQKLSFELATGNFTVADGPGPVVAPEPSTVIVQMLIVAAGFGVWAMGRRRAVAARVG